MNKIMNWLHDSGLLRKLTMTGQDVLLSVRPIVRSRVNAFARSSFRPFALSPLHPFIPSPFRPFLLSLLLLCWLFQGMAQEVNLNRDDNRNKQTISVKLYDTNEGDFLLDLPLTFHLNADNILFMIVGSEYDLGGNYSVWMFDKTLDLNTFLKQNPNVGASKSFKKNNKRVMQFYEQSENVEKYVLFERGFERVQSSPKPVFFQLSDPSKPALLKLRFYVASGKSNGLNMFSSEAGQIKIAVNIQKNK